MPSVVEGARVESAERMVCSYSCSGISCLLSLEEFFSLGRKGRTHLVEVSLKLGFRTTNPSVCFMTMVLEPSESGVTRVPRITKLAVPPESLVYDEQAYGPSFRLSWTWRKMSLTSGELMVEDEN